MSYMSNYVSNFRNYLKVNRELYKKEPDKFTDEVKQIFEDDRLFSMLQMFGESVIEFGEDSVSGYEAEYSPDSYDIINMFINFFIPLYNSNLELIKTLEEEVSTSVKPIIVNTIVKNAYPSDLVDKNLFDLV